MKKPCFIFLVACLASTVMLADHRAAAAATIEILATGASKWSSGGASSGGAKCAASRESRKG